MSERSFKVRASSTKQKMPDVLDGAEKPKKGPSRPISKSLLKHSSSKTDQEQSDDPDNIERPKKRGINKTISKSNLSLPSSKTEAEQSDDAAPKVVPKPKPQTEAERQVEEKVLNYLESAIEKVKQSVVDKQIIFGKLQAEVMRMLRIFDKLLHLETTAVADVLEGEQASQLHELTVQQRKELMEKGPFNLVFHGIEPDWIEEEMDDDPDFQRDVLEQKIKTIIREEVGIMRDVGILDCYRYKQGVPLRGAYPVIVTFKARREKEQILWRAKDKLRRKDIFVTEDSQARLSERLRMLKESPEKTAKSTRPPPAGKLKKSLSTNDFPRSPAKKWPKENPSLLSPTKKWPPDNSGSVKNSPKKRTPVSRPSVPPPSLVRNLPISKSLSKIELEELFDMDDDDDVEDFNDDGFD